MTYLIESTTFEPWLIGTEQCILDTDQLSQTAKKLTLKSSFDSGPATSVKRMKVLQK
jgi:hypothetical protein